MTAERINQAIVVLAALALMIWGCFFSHSPAKKQYDGKVVDIQVIGKDINPNSVEEKYIIHLYLPATKEDVYITTANEVNYNGFVVNNNYFIALLYDKNTK